MEKSNSHKEDVLVDIQSKLDKIIGEVQNFNEDNILYYQAIKKLIDFSLNEKEVKRQFKEFENVMIAIGGLNFTRRIKVENAKDIFAYFGHSLNLLNEELERKAIPKVFLEMVMQHVMKLKPDFAILANVDGKIEYISKNPESTIGFSKEKLMGKRIQNFISTNIEFKSSVSEEQKINLFNSDSEIIPAIMYVVELNHTGISLPSYLYMFKEKVTE